MFFGENESKILGYFKIVSFRRLIQIHKHLLTCAKKKTPSNIVRYGKMHYKQCFIFLIFFSTSSRFIVYLAAHMRTDRGTNVDLFHDGARDTGVPFPLIVKLLWDQNGFN